MWSAGLIRNIEQNDMKARKALNEAFQDLDSLMEKAKEMVHLAEKFSEKMKSKQKESAEDAEFKDWLITMGIASPVTKWVLKWENSVDFFSRKTAGALYHQELAKQLADFLDKGPLEKAKGMMTLTDAYSMYNRARGTGIDCDLKC